MAVSWVQQREVFANRFTAGRFCVLGHLETKTTTCPCKFADEPRALEAHSCVGLLAGDRPTCGTCCRGTAAPQGRSNARARNPAQRWRLGGI